jgi:enoyl-CoA hydratase/carnithine racemase
VNPTESASAHEPLVRIDIADGVASIVLNRPSKRNALNDALLTALVDALDRVESDATVRVLVLRGEGSSFCSGVDLGEKLAQQGTRGAVEFDLLLEAFERLEKHPNPVIAVLQGTSLAGGWELALHCDIRFAAPDARFGMPLARLGLVPPYAAVVRLVQIAGAAAATDLLLSAQLIDGTRAHAFGLVTHLVDGDRLAATAIDYARQIAALAPLSVREIKRLLTHAVPTPDPAIVAGFDAARRTISGSEDTTEGLQAFLERRPALFQGR